MTLSDNLDPAQLRKVIDELANALQVATVLATHLEKSTADVARSTFELRNAIARCVVAIMSLQPRRER
jgi:hypothetical protein